MKCDDGDESAAAGTAADAAGAILLDLAAVEGLLRDLALANRHLQSLRQTLEKQGINCGGLEQDEEGGGKVEEKKG